MEIHQQPGQSAEEIVEALIRYLNDRRDDEGEPDA